MDVDESLMRVGWNRPSVLTSAPKLLWFKRKYPQVWDQASIWLYPKDYIRFRLTGALGTEPSDASDSLFLDFYTKEWSGVAETYDLDLGKFPAVFQSEAIAGEVTRQSSAETGLAEGTPVAFGAADMACAALGTHALQAGEVSVTVGTVGHLITPIQFPKRSFVGEIYQFCHAIPNICYAFSAIPAGGLAFAWLRDALMKASNLSADAMMQRLNDLAEKIPDGSENLYFLPYLTGALTPRQNPHASGTFIGMRINHHAGHMAKALMEGVAYVFGYLIQKFEENGLPIRSLYYGDGGSSSAVWVSILKNCIGYEDNHIMENKESSSVGAAIIAGKGLGIYTDWYAAADSLSISRHLAYDDEAVMRYEEYKKAFFNIFDNIEGAYESIRQLSDIKP